MRVQPRAGIAVLLAVVYTAVVSGLWWLTGTDYRTVGDSTANVLRGIVLPVGAGAVFLAAAATYLGWWRPALREERRAGPRWLLLVPTFFFLAAFGTLMSGDISAIDPAQLVALAAGVLLVGFSEEMLCRGLGLVGLRGSVSEPAAWLWSCVIFALLHGVNALFGQSIGSTLLQMAVAVAAGTAFYVIRRISGLLIWCMLLHAFWDFGTLSSDAAPAGTTSPWAALAVAQWGAFVLACVGVVVLFRRHAATGAPAPAPSTRSQV
jgi:membrane protease YdiL (CAAX protease family)